MDPKRRAGIKTARSELTNRRTVLKGVSVAAGAALMAPGGYREARAREASAEWMTYGGSPSRPYGVPASHEGHVKRALHIPWEDLARAYSWSDTPLEKLRGTITPSGLHFEVHHSGVPEIDPEQHVLMIHGLVDNPIRFNLPALDRYPMVTRTHFLECAGNSYEHATSPEPLMRTVGKLHGLVSCSQWTGIPMRLLLEEAGVKPEGAWVIATGGDAANLSRSIPLEKMTDDTLLALYQNGERLRPEQGYPMRLLVPGWEGNMNVKWLTSLWVTDQPAHTRDEVGEYADYLADGRVLQFTYPIGVKSLITHPSGEMMMSGPGFYEISGMAWSGLGKVEQVEISADGGATWGLAELEAPVLPKAITRFRMPWQWDGGVSTLMSRARDDKGYIQPTRTEWSARYHPDHYGHFNAIQSWRITDKGEVHNVYA